MKNIDFLPKKYREDDARRKAGLWRLAVVALFGGTITAASVAQFSYRATVQSQLSDVQPLLAQAKASEAHLTQVRNELFQVTTVANLHAAVELPWPRTQIMAAVVDPLNESITLEQIELAYRQATSNQPNEFQFKLPSKKKQDEVKLPPARHDLKTVQSQLYQRQCVVHLTGTTKEQTELHRYLGRLQTSPLLDRVELLGVDSVSADGSPQRLRFTVEILVRAPLNAEELTAAENPAVATVARRWPHPISRNISGGLESSHALASVATGASGP